MSVEVALFANLREKVNKDKINISANTLKELLEKLTEQYSELEDEIYADEKSKKLKEYINLAVNGKRIDYKEEPNLELNSGDKVRIFPPVSGG
ncbi:MAG: ubiquitin-like small modifier protein 1 [Candidatus Hadarchaeia archaeon]